MTYLPAASLQCWRTAGLLNETFAVFRNIVRKITNTIIRKEDLSEMQAKIRNHFFRRARAESESLR